MLPNHQCGGLPFPGVKQKRCGVLRVDQCWKGSRKKLDKTKKPNIRMLQSEEVQAAFDSQLSELFDQSGHSCISLHDKWDTLVTNAAIPHHAIPMADWFLENEHTCTCTIRPVLEKRSFLLTTWLASGKEEDRQQYLKQKKTARRVIRPVKNKWYQSKASEIKRSTRSTRRCEGAWENIRQLQQAGRGLRPAISKAMKDENARQGV